MLIARVTGLTRLALVTRIAGLALFAGIARLARFAAFAWLASGLGGAGLAGGAVAELLLHAFAGAFGAEDRAIFEAATVAAALRLRAGGLIGAGGSAAGGEGIAFPALSGA